MLGSSVIVAMFLPGNKLKISVEGPARIITPESIATPYTLNP